MVKQIVAAMFVALCTVAANAAEETKTTKVTRALLAFEPPETKITSPADFAVFAAPANIVLAASFSSQLAYQVTFYNQGTYIGTGSSDTHTFTWENVPVGQYEITAFADDGAFGGAFSPPVHITVTGGSAPTVSVVATPDAATAPATIKLAATASDSDGTVAKVEFFNGTALLSTATHAPYEFNWANVGPGAYSITARATDNQGLTTTSAAVPVSVSTSGAKVYFVYTDQVNTPRAIIDAGGAQVWTSDGEPFGANAPNENPAGKGQFTFNLRFPGQYFDRETGLHYNYYRDYDPQTGRYIQSDPIGLKGGINTYAYVGGNPLSLTDSFGLAVNCKVVLRLPGFDIERCDEDHKTTPSEQDARDAKRMSDKELDKACKNNNYKDAHDMKRDMGLDSKSDIFSDKNGNMYSGPRQGTGLPQYLHMNIGGW